MATLSNSSLPELEVQKYLGENVRIVLDDGRVVEGEFRCMDKDMNFIINAAVEYHGMAEGTCTRTDVGSGSSGGSNEDAIVGISQRALGSAMVPGQHVVKIFGRAK